MSTYNVSNIYLVCSLGEDIPDPKHFSSLALPQLRHYINYEFGSGNWKNYVQGPCKCRTLSLLNDKDVGKS